MSSEFSKESKQNEQIPITDMDSKKQNTSSTPPYLPPTLSDERDDSTSKSLIQASRAASRRELLRGKRARNTEMLPRMNEEDTRGKTPQPRISHLHEENLRLHQEMKMLQEQLATYQSSMDLLDSEIETIHRDHHQEIEQYQQHLREILEEHNRMQEVTYQWEQRYQVLYRAFQDSFQGEANKIISSGSVAQNNAMILAESVVQIHILEEPLTLETLTTVFSALTEIFTKYWLISQQRFIDLMKYTQIHDERFAREAGVTVGKISHNSPFNFDVNLSASNVAEAVITTVDGITQARTRLAQKELEVLTQTQALEREAQQAEHEQQMAALEHEKQQLTLEQQRLEIVEKRLDLQKKAVESSLELAGTIIDRLQPGLDSAARAMAMQAILPNILQLQSVTGLVLALPAIQKEEETEPTKNK